MDSNAEHSARKRESLGTLAPLGELRPIGGVIQLIHYLSEHLSSHLHATGHAFLPIGGISRLDASRRVTEAAAPGLSFLQIAFVGSSNIGWEGITALQSMTSNDHGGAQLRVVTEEIGYGNLPVARFNGSVLANSKNYFTETICWNGSVYVIPCSAGQTIVGYRKYWNLDGYQIGSFSYQNKSTNSPWNTMSDSISIL